MYIGPKPKLKKNGDIRNVFDTKPPLKPLLKKINEVFFRRVYFPPYLTGSLSGRDFIANVDIHKGSRGVITEDIKTFYDSITEDYVCRIWREFFGFAEEVACLLTLLMTKEGRVFQGTPTSSYLANLAFWDREPALVERLAVRNIRYSRYVDDITLSSLRKMTLEDKRWAISQTYGMISAAGFKPQRTKHSILNAQFPISIMGLNANGKLKPSLTKQERSGIRALVFQLEQRFECGDTGVHFKSELNRADGKVGRLKRLHVREGEKLQCRLRMLRNAVSTSATVANRL